MPPTIVARNADTTVGSVLFGLGSWLTWSLSAPSAGRAPTDVVGTVLVFPVRLERARVRRCLAVEVTGVFVVVSVGTTGGSDKNLAKRNPCPFDSDRNLAKRRSVACPTRSRTMASANSFAVYVRSWTTVQVPPFTMA